MYRTRNHSDPKLLRLILKPSCLQSLGFFKMLKCPYFLQFLTKINNLGTIKKIFLSIFMVWHSRVCKVAGRGLKIVAKNIRRVLRAKFWLAWTKWLKSKLFLNNIRLAPARHVITCARRLTFLRLRLMAGKGFRSGILVRIEDFGGRVQEVLSPDQQLLSGTWTSGAARGT